MPISAESDGPNSWIYRFNDPTMTDAQRDRLLHEQLAAVGAGTVVRAPFYCDLGSNITLGSGTFLIFNCVVLDVSSVNIGDLTAIGPGVQILTSDHPRDATVGRQQIRYGRPVSIGANVWIGGGAIILPGISIGDDAIIGAGSVVTRDVAAGTTVAGSPARTISG